MRTDTADYTDYGPSVTRTRDGRLRSSGAGDVVLEDRADPDPTVKRLVRGARRRNALRESWDRGAISKPMHDAAVRFLDDCSLASGGMAGQNLFRLPGPSVPRSTLAERQLVAIRRVHRVVGLLGLNTDTVFWWVVIRNMSPAQFDEAQKLRHGTGASWLRLALEALDRHYNPSSRGREKVLDKAGR